MKTFKVSGHISSEEHAKLITLSVTAGVRSTAIVAYGVKLALRALRDDPAQIKKLDRDGRRAVA